MFRNVSVEGRLVELKAYAWLIRRGYEVYGNAFTAGAADVIALNKQNGELTAFEVRTGKKVTNSSGDYYHCLGLTPKQIQLGILLLVYMSDLDDFTIWTHQQWVERIPATVRPKRRGAYRPRLITAKD